MDQRDINLLALLSSIHKDLPTMVLTKLSPLTSRGYQLWTLENLVIETLPFLLQEIDNRPSTSTQ